MRPPAARASRPKLLPLLLLLCCVWAPQPASAQFGMPESAVSYEDFPFPEYAQPWEVGQQVCAYLKTQSGKRLYTTCFPYKQKICGGDTQFEYDCCPGYGHDSRFEGYTTGPLWPYNENCLKKLGRDDLRSSNDALLGRIGADRQTIDRLKSDMARYSTGQLTVFLPYKDSYKSARYDASAASADAAHVARGSYFAKHLLDQAALPNAAGDGSVKITRYSNGILCAECRRFVSADHSIDERAVVHFVDGFVYPSRQTLGEMLSSRYPHFWSDVPSALKSDLSNAECGRWYTVLVPSASSWSAARARAGTESSRQALVREHILTQLVCSAAVCQLSQYNKNLNSENVELGCEGEGRIYARGTHEFTKNEKAYLVARDGELDQMASNGVIYEASGALLHSGAFSYLDIEWPNVPPSCVTLDPAKKYIFLVPRETAWNRFRTLDIEINKEESMKKFSDWYARDADYRCLVRQYHVLEAGPDQVSLDKLWSQFNPRIWPADSSGHHPGSFRTLARWTDGASADAKRRNGYGFLRNQLHFQKSDTNPRLHYQFAPVRDASGFELKEGRGYMVDWVNIPPHESARDFFERRDDLKKHLDLLKKDAAESKSRGNRGLYETEASVQLIIVSKDAWYAKTLSGDRISRINTYYDRIRNNWNVTDFLLLNWGSLYYWVGDLGFLAKGEKAYIQSGHPDVLIGVYRHFQNGKLYTWNEMKPPGNESLQQVQSRWMEIVEYNHFKTDAIIWIVDRPQQCNKRLCQQNLQDGKSTLPWTFAAACGDFVTLETPLREPLKTVFAAAAGKMGELVRPNVTATIESGEERGQEKSVSCFGVAMVATRTIVFRNVDDELN